MCCNDTMCNDNEYQEIHKLSMQFPFILNKNVVWLDNSATTQKPSHVIKSITDFYNNDNSNIHRGSHKYANKATELYENARNRAKKYLSADNVIFTRGTTEALNLLANVLQFNYGDTVLLTEMEHHSNIVPWQLVAEKYFLNIDYICINDSGDIDMDDFYKKINSNVKVLSITHVSNVLGTVNDVKKITEIAKKFNIIVVVDGAQAVGHMPVNINDIGCDFYVTSCHKMFGPFGVGLLCFKNGVMDNLPPWQGGGGMIENVTFEKSTFSKDKYEAGTPNVADVVATNAMFDFLESVPWANVEKYENNLLFYAIDKLNLIEHLHIIGMPLNKVSVISFVIDNQDLDNIAKKLDNNNIIVRVGHHCSQPTIRHFGYEKTLRISFALYNTFYDVDMFILRLKEAL